MARSPTNNSKPVRLPLPPNVTQTRDRLAFFTGGIISRDRISPALAEHKDAILERVAQADVQRQVSMERRAARAGLHSLELGVLERNLRAEKGKEIAGDNRMPMIATAEAHRILHAATQQLPNDRGLQMAKAFVYNKFIKDMEGSMTVGEVYTMRAHFVDQFPKTKLAAVVEREFVQQGYTNTNTKLIFQLAASITTQEDYARIVRANGLDRPGDEFKRARDLLRALAQKNLEDIAQRQRPTIDGAAVAERVYQRIQGGSDPVLRDADMDDMPPHDDATAPGPEESEHPHPEESETLSDITSPITGEPLVVELGNEDAGAHDDSEGEEMEPMGASAEALQLIGQLSDFVENAPPVEGEPGEPVPEGEPSPEQGGAESTTTLIDDPSTDGEKLQLTLTPLVAREAPLAASPNPEMPVIANDECPEHHMAFSECGCMERDGTSKRTKEKKILEKLRRLLERRQLQGIPGVHASALPQVGKAQYTCFAVNNGVRDRDPIVAFEAENFPAALARVATLAIDAGVNGEVFVNSTESIIMLNSERGDYLHLEAKSNKGPETGSEFCPKINDQQPPQLDLGPDEGLQVLTQEKKLKQKRKAPHVSKDSAERMLAASGITRESINAAILEGKTVTAGSWNIKLTEDLDVMFWRSGAKSGKAAGLSFMDRAVDDFICFAAGEAQAKIAIDAPMDVSTMTPEQIHEHGYSDARDMKPMNVELQGNPEYIRGFNDGQMGAPNAGPGSGAMTQAKKKGEWSITPVFSIECPHCKSANTYSFPEEATDLGCDCGMTVRASMIADYFDSIDKEANEYILSGTFSPTGDKKADQLTLKRIVSTISRAVPGASFSGAEGDKFELHIAEIKDSAVDTTVKKIQRLLEPLGIELFEMKADVPEVPGAPAGATPATDTTPSAQPTNQAQPAPSNAVVPPMSALPMSQGPEVPRTSKMDPSEYGSAAQQKEIKDKTKKPKAFRISFKVGDKKKFVRLQAASKEEAGQTFSKMSADQINKLAQDEDVEPEAPAEPVPGGGGPAQEVMPVPQGAEPKPLTEELLNLETPVPPGSKAEDIIKSSMTYYRFVEYLGPAEAIAKFMKEFEDNNYDQTAVIRICGEIYSENSPELDQSGLSGIGASMKSARLAAKKQAADKFSPKVKTQHGPAVTVPKDLGPDSTTHSDIKEPGKPKQQHPATSQSGTSLADPKLGPDSQTGHKGFPNPGKPKQHHPVTDQKGTSLTPTDLGRDSQTGENKETRKLDRVFKGTAA